MSIQQFLSRRIFALLFIGFVLSLVFPAIFDSGFPETALAFSLLSKNPFFTTRKLEGHCGLGIPIAEKIIKAHNGSLKIVNIEKGRGTEAIIYLPGKDTKDI